MIDTMTFTKAGAALCIALLVFLFAKWGADGLYATEAGHGGHGEEEHSQGYVIASLDDHGDDHGEEAVEVSFEEVYATADAEKGAKVFSKCKSCHKLEDGANGTGPHLFGVVDRAVGGVDGFGYSDPMAALGGTWTPEVLSTFLENPKAAVPGTKMTFSGLKKIEDRANLIAYLAGNPG